MGQRAMHMFTLHKYKYFLQNGSIILHSHKHMILPEHFCFIFSFSSGPQGHQMN